MCNDRILHGDFCVTTKNQLAITLFSCVSEPHEVLPEASHNGIDAKIIPISLSYFRTWLFYLLITWDIRNVPVSNNHMLQNSFRMYISYLRMGSHIH